jgi:hypothetical protein
MAQMLRLTVPFTSGCASSARVRSDTSAAAAAAFDSSGGAAVFLAAASALALLRAAALARPTPAWQARRGGGRASEVLDAMRCEDVKARAPATN